MALRNPVNAGSAVCAGLPRSIHNMFQWQSPCRSRIRLTWLQSGRDVVDPFGHVVETRRSGLGIIILLRGSRTSWKPPGAFIVESMESVAPLSFVSISSAAVGLDFSRRTVS